MSADLPILPVPHSRNTRRSYERAQRQFREWCVDRGLCPLPATDTTVVAWLTARAEAGIKPSTLDLDLAGIRDQHRRAGEVSPTAYNLVRAAIRALRESFGVAPRRAAPLTAEQMVAVLTAVRGKPLLAQRDRALLTLGLGSGLRRSEIVALNVNDLTFIPGAVLLSVRRSFGDQRGEGIVITLPEGARLRPATELRNWLVAADLKTGAVFRPLTRGGRALPARLSDRAVSEIVKRSVGAAGLNPTLYSGHSLRSGFFVSALSSGARWEHVARAGRNGLQQVQSYINEPPAPEASDVAERFL